MSSWRPAALQAQAVAARTYSVFHRNRVARRACDLCDTVSCQVYGGNDSEKASTNTAIAATAGRLYQVKSWSTIAPSPLDIPIPSDRILGR